MNAFIRLTEITQSVKQERRGTITDDEFNYISATQTLTLTLIPYHNTLT